MCGICGKLNFTGEKVDGALINRMSSTLFHRGPDDGGIYLNGSIGLGHRRLSIIDLSPLGHQPMCNEDGTVWVVFNGEIYNFQALKKDLENKGHIFRSHSDTEALIHLYEEEGPQCVRRLRGMFAFAIWSEKEQTLFLARDRVGKKPLFYYLDDRRLIFASEIKAILQDPDVAARPDLTAIHHYLTYQSVPSPFSAFQGVSKLPPAHYLICRNGKVEIERYWQLSYLPKFAAASPAAIRDLESELVERLGEAVRLRLISDVPLGAFLSGGVDSSVVVALMSRVMKEPVRTFSVGFHEKDYDELSYARIIARRFETVHTEFQVKPDAVDILPKLVWHYNEPFADPAAIPSYYVSKLARQHVTVVLNGDGGDESFAGYERYVGNELAMRSDLMPLFMKKLISAFFSRMLPSSRNPNSFLWKLKRFSQTLLLTPELRNAQWLTHFNNEAKALLYSAEFNEKTGNCDSYDIILGRYSEAEATEFIDRTLYADVALYLPDTLLVKMDIASMANSLEARSPFLDYEVMEFAARIPARLKLHKGRTKIILKDAFSKMLPRNILERKKMGFGVPLDHWFRNELKGMAYDVLLGQRAVERGYFRKEYVRKMLDEHVSGQWNRQYHIYNLLMLELWHRQFIDSAGKGP